MVISSGHKPHHDRIAEQVIRELDRFPGFTELNAHLLSIPNGRHYVVGGAVRNAILGLPINDIDIFLSRKTLDALFALGVFRQSDLEYGALGSPRWWSTSCSYFDLVPIESVHHGFSKSLNIRDSLQRFDVTGNALAVDTRDHVLLDPLGGLNDLAHKVIGLVRFDHTDMNVLDGLPLPWRAMAFFRLIHYAATLDFEIEAKSAAWLQRNLDCFRFFNIFRDEFFEPRLDHLPSLYPPRKFNSVRCLAERSGAASLE